MAIRYISDTHFGHFNCLRYDNRPWQDVESMRKDMIQRWNAIVSKEDTVYILGDVVWSKHYSDWVDVLSRLNGHLFIVKGNHDRTEVLQKLKENGFIVGWSHQEIVQDSGRYVVLNHSPMPFFVNMHHDNTYHLYGHVHISWDAQVIKHVRKQIEDLYLHEIRMYNCGCMVPKMGYVPRTLDEIISIDKINREEEAETLEDYMKSEIERGHDKIRIAQ